jgi:hypothetical protein
MFARPTRFPKYLVISPELVVGLLEMTKLSATAALLETIANWINEFVVDTDVVQFVHEKGSESRRKSYADDL